MINHAPQATFTHAHIITETVQLTVDFHSDFKMLKVIKGAD